MLDELRRTFTSGSKPIPPKVFADFGDSGLADSDPIRVTIDLVAAVGSNLCGDDITTRPKGWVAQKKKAPARGDLVEETSYKFVGATQRGPLELVPYGFFSEIGIARSRY